MTPRIVPPEGGWVEEPEDGTLIVTPEQFAAGWMERNGMQFTGHRFRELGRTPEGNYIVAAPKIEEH